MIYKELIIETPEQEIDERCARLAELGIGGFVIENEADFRAFLENNRQYWDYVDRELEDSFRGLSRIKCYIEDSEEGERQFEQVSALYPVTVNIIADDDWDNRWKSYYKPLRIGEKLLVVPDWEDASEEGRINLRLEPGLMFGTGSHPTTSMSLAAMEKYAAPGKKVLDLGCGSGILGIGALILGADTCVGCDIDAKAPDIVMENAALNGIGSDRMRVLAGDITKDASLRRMLGTGYDIVLANIVSDVILAIAPFVRSFMADGGVFITSGIIDDRASELKAALERAGFTIIAHYHEGEWHCFECK